MISFFALSFSLVMVSKWSPNLLRFQIINITFPTIYSAGKGEIEDIIKKKIRYNGCLTMIERPYNNSSMAVQGR